MPRLKISLLVLLLAALHTGIVSVSVSYPAQGRASITLKDSLERTVLLPSKVERIISIQPEISRIIVSLGAGDNLVGMDYTLRLHDPMFKLTYPGESRLSLVSMAENSVNLEMVLRLRPDVIFVSPYERQIVDSLRSVKFHRVYYTLGFWDWWDVAEVLIETLYLAKLFYPEKFSGFDLRREGNAVFEKFYGIEDGFSALCKILQCEEWTHE
jgi:ABC-type Fe3+-hydroxamate transport system substrate-binding protein